MKPLAAAALLVFIATDLRAERVLTREGRADEATHIVVAEVSSVVAEDKTTTLYGPGTVETRFTLVLKPVKFESGPPFDQDTTVFAHAWRLKSPPPGKELTPGPGGHLGLPQRGDRVRAFLVLRQRVSADNRDEAHLDVVYPTGFEALPTPEQKKPLREPLTFHAGFDGTTDAAVGRGDRRLHVGPQWGPPRTGPPGLPPGETVVLTPGKGRFGDALEFRRRIKELVYYPATGNLEYRTNDWSGTVSMWLKVDPEHGLEPGYCDMIQITSKDWNDAAFFTDFSKDDQPREFRLGAFADLPVWNPTNRKWDDILAHQRPMVTAKNPRFGRDRWTHVVFTWEHFNTGRPDGVATLYVDGTPQPVLGPRTQTFSWDLPETCIMLGLSYTGLMDDVAIFNRALSAEEILVLYRLVDGVKELAP